MSPSVLMDTSDDFVMPNSKAAQPSTRTLLLSPPSLSSHQEKLTAVIEMHDRAHTDLQMIDRLALGLVSLPQSAYDVIIILCDADGSRRESQNLMNREVLTLLVRTLKNGGHIRSQDGNFGAADGLEKNEAILAGLSPQPGVGFVKVDYSAQVSIPLKFGKKKTADAAGGLKNGSTDGDSVSLPLNAKRKSVDDALPAGVGFDDGTDDLSDDELIDEDTLLDEDDLKRTIKIREFCSVHSRRTGTDEIQPLNASPRPNGAELAKTVHVASHRNWKPRIARKEKTPIKH
jgi:anamorsin